jgi:hypothetical protein
MSPRRFGRPGLIGMAARTAVVAGTATAVSGSVARHQQARAQDAQQQAGYPAEAPYNASAQEQPAAAPPAAAPAENALLDQLGQLAQLHASGVLDDAEFAAAKAKLLA